jgi:hypothetical protein
MATSKKPKKTARDRRHWGVETWDIDLQRWTPQIGIPPGPFTRRQMVETIIPLLDDMGYPCDESDLEDDSDASPYLSIFLHPGGARIPGTAAST